MNVVARRAQEALNTRGYLVAAWVLTDLPLPVVGTRLDRSLWSLDEEIDPPFFVVGETTLDDYVEQAVLGGWPMISIDTYRIGAARYDKFFRLVAE